MLLDRRFDDKAGVAGCQRKTPREAGLRHLWGGGKGIFPTFLFIPCESYDKRVEIKSAGDLVTVKTTVDESKRLTTHAATGELTFPEILETVQAFYENQPTENQLWDLRNASTAGITAEQIQDLADIGKRHGELRTGGKTAIVVSTDADFGLSRVLEAFIEIQEVPFSVMGFRSIDKALEWLGEPPW